MPPFLIGRPGYDNCLLQKALMTKGVISIDGSSTVYAVHLTGSDGNRAGLRRMTPDYYNNYHICRNGYRFGLTSLTLFKTYFSGVNIVIQSRKSKFSKLISNFESRSRRMVKLSGGDALTFVYAAFVIIALFFCITIVTVTYMT